MTSRVSSADLPPLPGSALSLTQTHIEAESELELGHPENDSLVFVVTGDGELVLGDGRHGLRPGSAGLVLAGEYAGLRAGAGRVDLVLVEAGPETDRHAPLGVRETVTELDAADAEAATGARSFQILFGPHNGSTRATLFAGFLPPGKAPWHYHLYDELVWIPEGPGRLHVGGEIEELGPGSAFRLRPREVHVVENAGEKEMTLLGVFTPAGTPSAAYLA